MNLSLSAGTLLALTAFATPIFAQERPKASTPKLLTPEASLNLRSISDLQFSPDGNRLAFVVTEPAKGEAGHLTANSSLSFQTAMISSRSTPCGQTAAKPAP